MKEMNIQFHKTRPQNPFDDGAKARLHRMGLLRIDGSVDEATLNALSRAYSGLLFDDLCDTCQNSCEITEILRRLYEAAEQAEPRQKFLLICLQYDALSQPLPNPIWWISGDSEAERRNGGDRAMKGLLIYQPTSKSAPLADFIDGLDPRLREKILLRLYFLTQLEKPEMKEPHFKRFSIERYRDLWELRVKSKVLIRIIFCTLPNGDVLLLHGFVKRQKRDTMQALEQSIRILDALREHPERAVEYKIKEEKAS